MKSLLSLRPLSSLALVSLILSAACTLGSASLHASSFQPSLVFPANHDVLYCPHSTITLRWTDISGMNTYFVDVASDSAMSHHILQKVVQFDTTLDLTIGSTATTLYWTVSTGVETSPVGVFQTRYAGKVTLATTYNGAELQSDVVHFAWNADPAAQKYTVQLTNGAESSLDTTFTGTECTLVLPREKMMYWRVRSECSAGSGEWSLSDSVRIAALVNDVSTNDASSSLLLYPQPCHADLRVVIPENWNVEATAYNLFDLLGRPYVVSSHTTSNGAVLNLRSVAAGAYILHVCNGTHEQHMMISIQ